MSYKQLIQKMTLEEKASFLSGKDFWQTQDMEKFGITSMFLSDGPNGIRKQELSADHLGLNESLNATCFPTAATMANSWNTDLGEEMATALGQEAVSQKVNVLLGPGINIKRNPLCGRNFEYFSEDPYLAGKMGAAYARGIQKSGVSSCLKHFAANNIEERRMVLDTIVDERTFREIYLTGFEIAVKEGKSKTIMSSYNRINGVYANENKLLLDDILRKEWGFNGVVVTDWGGNNDRVEALKAGNELEMPTTGGETNRDVIAAVKSGAIPEKLVDDALERLLTLIFDTEEVFKKPRAKIDKNAHHIIAQKAAEESIVLLKNNNVLPLNPKQRTAIIGDFASNPRYQGSGSSVVNPFMVDTTLDYINDYGLNFIGYAAGFKRYGKSSASLIKKAVNLAKLSDVVLLYIGLDEATETEGLDRTNMQLPQNQRDLIAALKTTGKKIIAVVSCGSSLEMDWADDVDGVINGYLGGQAGAKAMLNALFGKINPSGKLAESYPYKYSDCSSAANFFGRQKTIEYREGLFVGYRYYDTAGIPVRYPFGYGLSYTTFSYYNLNVTDKGVNFSVTNSGNVAGAEIAQLYVGKPNGEVFRPRKELKGFAKVFLQAGETAVVEISFNDYTFRYYNTLTKKWEIEGGAYSIMVGASSANIILSAEVTQTGTNAPCPYDKNVLTSYYSGKTAAVSDAEFEKLYGKKLPNANYDFIKKNRMLITINTTVSELRYAKGWTGRFFAWGLRFGYKFLRAIGKRKSANVIMLGMFHMPMRGMSRMTGGAISYGQLEGLMQMFNGKFFKGLGIFIKQGGVKSKRIKAEKKLKKANMQKENNIKNKTGDSL